jgi:hypothetical protein
MELEGSLPCSQQHAKCLYPEQANPVCVIPPMLKSHTLKHLQKNLLIQCFCTSILYAFPISSTTSTCPAHLTVLDMITNIIFGEEHMS